MRTRLCCAILFAALAGAQPDVIEHIRAAALDYNRNLPNFVCVQVTERQDGRLGPDPHWKTTDRIEEQLSYFEGREKYEIVSINGKPPGKQSHDTLKNFRSSGEFGATLRRIFETETQTSFKIERSEAVSGRTVYVLAYRVEQEKSKIVVTQNRERATVAYHGTILADAKTGSVLRVSAIGDMPGKFPVRASSSEVEYETIEIAGKPYLLPARSVTSIETARYRKRNLISYREYRKFDADAAIKFETGDKK